VRVELVARAQVLVDGSWTRMEDARRACREQRWAALVRELAPRAPRLLGRWDHARCVEHAAAMCEGPDAVTIQIVPVWAGSNPDDEPSSEWYAAVALQVAEEPLTVVDGDGEDLSPSVLHRVICRGRRWRVGLVIETKSYAPSVELALRAGAFGVVENDVYEVESAEEVSGGPVPRPTRTIPPFCSWFEPAVAGLPAELVRAIRGASITVDERGNVIEDG
jgi:hypothetical protein